MVFVEKIALKFSLMVVILKTLITVLLENVWNIKANVLITDAL